MKYLILVASIIASVRTISYGIYEIKNNSNLSRWNFRNINCYYYSYLS